MDAFTGALMTIEAQPLLQGLQQAFSGYEYDETGKPRGIGGRLYSNVAKNLLPSFMPTFFGQVRQSLDNTARETYDPNPLKVGVNRALNKLPIINRNLPIAYKTLGVDMPREIYQNGHNNLFNVFLNPGFTAEYRTDPLATMLLNTVQISGETRQLPEGPPKVLKASKTLLNQYYGTAANPEPYAEAVSFPLTGDDFAALQRVSGYYATSLLKTLNPAVVEKLTPSDQVKAVNELVNDAAGRTREWFVKHRSKAYLQEQRIRQKRRQLVE